ncbi:MAG: threonine--tRNA ligase [Chitinivibrionales bacterium]|nr:threonine--tRNA ligase [Chitinivibrionales bacterium]
MLIILPDGSSKECAQNATALDCAAAIGPRLASAAVACRVNGELCDLSVLLHENDKLEILTFDKPDGKAVFWHTASHILAQAVQELYPSAKLAIGPAIENGFYYDFDVDKPFLPEDLTAIEARCREIAARKLPLERLNATRAQAQAYFESRGEIYKQELLAGIEGEPTLYKQGDWQDLCRGPHLSSTEAVRAIKLLNVAGAYWRGSEKNKMLQRIYGIAFPKQTLLDEYLRVQEEAAKRDHRRIGKELDLFSFHQEGAGFPFWHPKGMALYNAIADFSRQKHLQAGYQEVKTPIILNEELWRRSGHWDKYRDNMYFTQIDEATHAIKPMNCPGGLLIYKTTAHSYRELPIKNFEFGLVHRHEKAGVLHGLFRVRQFTQDDAHIFCTPEQIGPQIGEVIDFVTDMYAVFGFTDDKIELSTRPEKFLGSIDIWDKAEAALKGVLEQKKIVYQLNPGDGAFYGPKIDFHVRDCLNRTWQCGTIQLDFSMPKLFELEYTDANSVKQCPVMIHRALLGSMERFIGILLEHYGGALPVWLAPVQVRVLPISDRFLEYARAVHTACKEAGLRVELDERSEKIGYKIRAAEMEKIPFMMIVGDKEQQAGAVALRRHTAGDLGAKPLPQAIAEITAASAQRR